ncbi:MAG: TfoX/Sxy family protein [Oscillospiraceae bacterium]|nr:TfoX/Sxy family protein [Oscillospiraceae bacterium]
MTSLTSLKNIGKEMEKKLQTVGITTAEELKQAGSKEAFVRLKLHYANITTICPVHLYTLEGAITDTEYSQLPENVVQDLKAFCDSLK